MAAIGRRELILTASALALVGCNGGRGGAARGGATGSYTMSGGTLTAGGMTVGVQAADFVVRAGEIFGIVAKFTVGFRFPRLSTVLYLGMGWLAMFAIKPITANLEPGGVWLLVAGGLAYSLGTIFYVLKRVPYMHAVWHLFVLGGSVLHWFAVYFYVVPGPPGSS